MPPSRAFVSHAAALGFLLALPLAVQAHEVVPADWCVNEKTTPKIVAQFDFDGKELHELMDKCGIVEQGDEWSSATQTMIHYCQVVAPLKKAVPFIVGPGSYRSDEHHSSYRLEQGISGSCAICPPKTE